ncbi:MAG: DUF6062 family protein [Anaerolineae bacterium]|nr:DUF6062 family protein [Anaerolineae bacterium]
MRQQRPSRHTTFHEVLDVLQQEGCPICRLGVRAVSRHLDVLSYEGVNDPGGRAELRRARGFCHGHAWQFANEVRDGLGTAIIYRDVLGALLPLLRPRSMGAPRPRGRAGALERRLLPQADCPACRTLAGASRRYLDTLLSHLSDADVRRRYRSSDGLCRPHLVLALPHVRGRTGLDLLTGAFRERVGALASRSTSAETGSALVEALVGKPLGVPRTMPSPEAAQAPEHLPPADLQLEPGAGCLMCRAVQAEADRWLVGALAAAGQAPEGEPLVDLCGAHAWRLMELAPWSQTGPAWQRVTRTLLHRLTEPQDIEPAEQGVWRELGVFLGIRRPSSEGETLAARIAQRVCPACRAEAAAAAAAAKSVLASITGSEGALEAMHGVRLCRPHLALALSLAPDEAAEWRLIRSALGRWQALHAELGEYIRKQDYRFRHEPYGAEVDAPWRAVAEMAGEE